MSLEVQPRDLEIGKEYLVEFTSYDGESVKEKGTFVKVVGPFFYFKVPAIGDENVPFQDKRSKFYNLPSSGGKRMKKRKNKTRNRKGKQTRHRKRKQTRRMK